LRSWREIGRKEANPTTLFNYGRPIINVRSDQIGPPGDKGLVDILWADLLFLECHKTFNNKERKDFIINVLRTASGKPYISRLFNIYVNRSITETRGFHAKRFGDKVKAFLYLDDVASPDNGLIVSLATRMTTSRYVNVTLILPNG